MVSLLHYFYFSFIRSDSILRFAAEDYRAAIQPTERRVMALVYGLLRFIAIAWPSVLHVYFDLFSGAIQTYVFCMLTMTYVTQACETDE